MILPTWQTVKDFFLATNFLPRRAILRSIRDLAPDAPTLEGFLFPATYEFPRHMTGKDMTAAMVKRFRQVWITLPSADALAAHRSAQDIVTLASLVERETPRPEERPHVAGVFENRLRIGQPLQCDPTVAYALTLAGKYNGKLDGERPAVSLPPTTPTRTRACRRGRSPIRAKQRCARLSIRRRPTISTLSPIPRAGTFSARPFRSIIRTSRGTAACSNSRRIRAAGGALPAPADEQIQSREVAMTRPDHPTKKEMILEIARELSVPRFTPAEVEQIRRQLVARLGAAGKTSPDYIAGVLETAGMRIVWSTKADTEGPVRGRIPGPASFCDARGRGDVHRAPG